MRIDVENVSFSYGNKQVLKDVNLKLPDGGLISIVGPNGLGKSTVMKIISGALLADVGAIKLDDRVLKSYDFKELSTSISYVAQNTFS